MSITVETRPVDLDAKNVTMFAAADRLFQSSSPRLRTAASRRLMVDGA